MQKKRQILRKTSDANKELEMQEVHPKIKKSSK